MSQLYKDNAISEVMRETPDVARRRAEIQEMRSLLQKALEIVNEVSTFDSLLFVLITDHFSSLSCSAGSRF